MAKTSIYVPDDLAEQVRRYGIPVPEVVKDALHRAVEAARIKERAMEDIAAVAARLRGDRREVDDGARRNGRDDGITWARQHATADELEQLAEHGAPGRKWASLLLFFSLKESKRVVDLEIDANEEPYWQGFVEGALEIRDAVSKIWLL